MIGATAARRAFIGFFVGLLLMQASWILAVPAFRGSDEFDHVYKAAAVAQGQWTARDLAQHGRGSIVTIPRSIVRAASPVCQYYDYVGHDNCFPIRLVGSDRAQVATAAGSYNPAYYVLVGTLARPFSGAAADYAMRIVSAVVCAALLGWAAAVIARWAKTTWPLVVFGVALTPVLVYSTAVAAPNGVTYSSAALLWASLMGLARGTTDGTGGRGLVLPLTVGAVGLVATHTTGPMWLALVGGIVLVLRPARDWIELFRRRRGPWFAAAAVIIVAVALCISWIRLEHTNALGTKTLETGPFPFSELPLYQTLWAFQGIAAFPLRNEPAPVPVYVIWGLPLLAVLVLLLKQGGRRERAATVLTLALLAVVPTVLTVASFRTESVAWQGRYALPLLLGIPALAGLALDRRGGAPRPTAVRILFGLLATAMAISTVHVAGHEIAKGPTDPVVAGFVGGLVLVGVLAVLGALTPLAALAPARPEPVLARAAGEPGSVGGARR